MQGHTVLSENPAEIRSGRILQNRYEVLQVLGQGGMGTVYMARDLRLRGRSCVVKKLRDDFYREEDRQKALQFFAREIDVLSQLEHRSIVQIKDHFSEYDDYFLVMEYVQGNNLHYMLHEERQGEPFAENTVVEWALQVCDALSYLHSQIPAVIYRDLKPSNIMIDLKGEVKLVDFGIARPWEEQGEHTHVVSAGYSPPEQYWGQADPRSDIYSLGATMHFLLTGQDPEALHVCSPKSLNPDVSDYIDQLVQRATAQEPDNRFPTVEELMEALLHKDFIPAPETPRSRVGEIVTGVILLVVAIFIFMVDGWKIQDGNTNQENKNGTSNSTGSDTINIDERAFRTTNRTTNRTTLLSGKAEQQQVSQTELAVQVMDEKDLTDPAGLPQEQQQTFGFEIPWLKK